MSASFDDLSVGKRLFIGKGNPELLGRGPFEVRGSMYCESPAVFGRANQFPNVWATVMIGKMGNRDSPPPFLPGFLPSCSGPVNHSPYSLAVRGDAVVFNHLDVAKDVTAGRKVRALGLEAIGDVVAGCGLHRLSIKKDFDIKHPTKEGWRLTHSCVEGPEAAVYVRGRVKNKKEIKLPGYWKNLVDVKTITVNLTPIGSHQDVIVKRWDDEKIYLQSNGGLPIDCFYYIMAERIDTEKLIPEYEGNIEDYPGDNNQRSIVGYNYDIKK
jgi:hypothetical protein